MTITALATQLFTDFSHEERNLVDVAPYYGRAAAVMGAMNSAMQELYGEGSPWLRQDEIGVIIHGPTAVTVAVTNDSTAATITGWASWMAGCLIVIEGSDVDNEIRNASASSVLKYPYDGTTGTKAATVYHNSITVPDTVMRVLDPIRFNRLRLAATVTSQITSIPHLDQDFGYDHRHQNMPVPESASKTLGTPVAYSVETWSTGSTAQPGTRITIIPTPGTAGVLDYRAMLAPPAITALTSSATLPIPQQFAQSIFYPVARKHLSGSPFFRSSAAADEINRSYQEAKTILDKLNPGLNQGRVTRSLY